MVKKAAAKPERQPPPIEPAGTWQDRLLALNINNVHKSRTCEVFLLAEYDESHSPAIRKFKNGGKIDPLNALKAVSYDDILKNIEIFSQDASGGVLYHGAAQEAANYSQTDRELPRELLALLIKMQIVFTINQDVAMTQKKILEERDLDNERAALVQSTETRGKDKKGKDKKGKDKKDKKDKGKKGKDKKGKGSKKTEEKVYDVCDSNNEPKPKPTSKLAKQKKEDVVVHEAVEVDPKHLFMVTVGFYDFSIIEELFKIGVPIAGVVEVTKPPVSVESDSMIDDEVNVAENESTESQQSESESESSSQEPKLEATEENTNMDKPAVLRRFWNQIYDWLESDDGCPEFLNNTVHITVKLPNPSFDESTQDEKHFLSVFSDIGSEIVKSPDIQRQHVNYVRNLKICPVGPKPTKAPPSTFQLYNKIIDLIPPDCCNIFTIVYALVQEVAKKVADPPQIILETPPSTVRESETTDKSTTENSLLNINSKMYRGVRGEITKILNQNLSHRFESGDDNKNEYGYDPKIDINISSKAFLVQEHNDLEIELNSYSKLTSKLLDINVNKLVVSNEPALLWKRYPYIEGEQKILTQIYALQTIADNLDLPRHELQYIIHTILFNSFACSRYKSNDANTCGLQLIFPQKTSSTVPPVIKQHIRNKHPVELYEIPEDDFEVQVPYVEYLDKPNFLEAKNLCAYKWYEPLSDLVTLQELHKTEQNYLCLDYKYCTFDDSILLRYHNDVDEFGINTTTWSQSLRTPVATLREFCKYVIHVEAKWLEEEEEKYIEEYEKQLDCAMDEDHKIKQQFYPDLVFTEMDFIQRRSLKGRMLEELRKPPTPVEKPDKKGGKGGNKDKKSKDKSSKGKGNKGASGKGKSKGEKSGATSQILVLEKLSKPTMPPIPRKQSLRCAQEHEPFSFYAYDVSDGRVQLTGPTTTFHSQDGFKVTVDQARFIGKPRKLSLNIHINGHSLILHHHQATILEPFTFHFALLDRTIIAFAKPLRTETPEEKLSEKICQAIKRKDDQKRQDVYFVSEKRRAVLKCFNIPYVTRRNIVLSEDLMVPFLNQLNMRSIKTRLAPTESLSSADVQKFEEALGEGKVKSKRTSSIDSQNGTVNAMAPSKYIYDVIAKAIESNNTVKAKEQEVEEVVEEEHVRTRRSLSEDSIGTIPQRRSNRKLLKKIRRAVESHLPLFKICSSRLHKHQYVKRIKSRVEIPIGTVLKRIPCKYTIYKPSTNLEISKLLPVKPRSSKPNLPRYDIRISLPSGLSIQSIEGTGDLPFNIRQRYLDKGPQCKNIAQEYSRTFTRDANIIIKKRDGNVDVFGISGQRVKCEIPYLKVNSVFTSKQKKCPKRRGNDLIPLHTSSLTKFQKQLNRSIHRLQKHLIDGYNDQHLMSHRACQRWKKNYIKDSDQIYILQNGTGGFKKFSLITSDGKKLKVTPSIISEEKIYYTSTATDYRYEEIYYGREDGAHSIINRESVLVTQFPDGTRITTWIEVDREIVFLEKQEEVVEGNTRNEEQQVFDFDLGNTLDLLDDTFEDDTLVRLSTMTFHSESNGEGESEESIVSTKVAVDDVGWVSVHLNIKYEHPNYATIAYYGRDGRTEIILPNNVTVVASSEGEYLTTIDEIRTNITTQEILMEAKLCNSCMQKSVNKLNIKPLYYKSQLNPHTTELLRTNDSFKKIFIVNYAGQCFRNVKYQNGRMNLSGCKNHANVENQKLFVLTRSLMGCKLWNIDSYRKRLTDAKRNGMDVHETELRVEIRNYVYKPHHEKFLIPYEAPTLVLTKNKPKEQPPKKLAYVTRQVINDLPDIRKLYPIYSVLLDVCTKKGADVSESILGEFKIFLNHVVDEILGKHKIPSDSIKEPEMVSLSEKEEPIPFEVRYQQWLKECAEYWKQIREHYVPKYFYSKYFYLVSGTSPSDEGKSSNPTLPICQCKETPRSPDSPLCDCSKIGFIEPDGSFVKTIHTINTHEALKMNDLTDKLDSSKDLHDQAPSSTRTVSTSQFTDSPSATKILHRSSSGRNEPLVSQTNLESTVSLPTSGKLQTWWCKTEVGKRILAETRGSIVKIAVKMPADKSEEVLPEKIESATKQLFDDLVTAVQKYETNMSQKNYIASSANVAVENVLRAQLNAIELILLLDNVEREAFVGEVPVLCSPVLDRLVTGGSSSDLAGSFEPCKVLANRMQEEQEIINKDETPYFGTYSYYSNIYDVLKPKLPEPTLEENLKTVFETDQVETISLNVQADGCISAKIDTSCESSDPCHIEEKFKTSKYYEVCEKCTDYAKTQSPQASPSGSVKRSQSQVIFSVPCVHDELENILLPPSPTSSSIITTFDTCIATRSSDTLSNVEISPNSSLLQYCLVENLAAIEGSTAVFEKCDHMESPSMMVLFSVASLRDKETEIKPAGPYAQRNPDQPVRDIENIVAGTKAMTTITAQTCYQPVYDSPMETEDTRRSLLNKESLHRCRKCIMQLNEELDRSESLSRFKTKSVASLLAALKRAESDDAMSSIDKERITTSLLNIIDSVAVKPDTGKYATGKLFAAITDEDAKKAKGSRSVLTASRIPLKEAIRKSVGSQTQPKVDRMHQTSSLRFQNG